MDSATPDKFLEILSYMLAFGEKDESEDFALLVLWISVWVFCLDRSSIYESPSSQ